MDVDVARKIVDFLSARGNEVRLREDYSGRGMYGERTVGIVVDGTYGVVMIGYAAARLGVDPADLPGFQDSMGYDLVVY